MQNKYVVWFCIIYKCVRKYSRRRALLAILLILSCGCGAEHPTISSHREITGGNIKLNKLLAALKESRDQGYKAGENNSDVWYTAVIMPKKIPKHSTVFEQVFVDYEDEFPPISGGQGFKFTIIYLGKTLEHDDTAIITKAVAEENSKIKVMCSCWCLKWKDDNWTSSDTYPMVKVTPIEKEK